MRVVAEVCGDRKAETLIPIIQSTIKPNSEIWSDLWKAYGSLNNLGFTHKTVNHSENFVDPNTKVNTQKIEGTWSLIKKFLKKIITRIEITNRYIFMNGAFGGI